MGFITKSELNEARMIAKLNSLMLWQKRRIVKIYCVLLEPIFKGFTPVHESIEFDKLLRLSISYFKVN